MSVRTISSHLSSHRSRVHERGAPDEAPRGKMQSCCCGDPADLHRRAASSSFSHEASMLAVAVSLAALSFSPAMPARPAVAGRAAEVSMQVNKKVRSATARPPPPCLVTPRWAAG